MKKLLILSCMVLASIASSKMFAQSADGDVSLSISPAIVDIAINPGDITKTSIVFFNNSADPLAATIEAETLLPIDDVIDQSRRDEFDASTWIAFEKDAYAFDANDQKTIEFTVHVPENATPGGHYAQITLKPGIMQTDLPTSQTKVLPQISASIFITVSGDINEQASIDSSQLSNLGFITKGSQTDLSFTIENTGNVHILPAPKIVIAKNNIETETLSLQPQIILPNTKKTFTTSWLANGTYGKYQVNAQTIYGTAGTPLVSNVATVTLIPSLLQLGLASLLIPVFFFSIIKYHNIPKALSVLQGRAHLKSAEYKQPKNHKDHALASDSRIEEETLPEIAKELHRGAILGLPINQERDLVAEMHESEAKRHNAVQRNKVPQAKPPLPDQSVVTKDDGSITKVIQTSSSTIVKEDPAKESSIKNHSPHITILRKPQPKKEHTHKTKSKKIIIK